MKLFYTGGIKKKLELYFWPSANLVNNDTIIRTFFWYF